jgi:hypothetical protein
MLSIRPQSAQVAPLIAILRLVRTKMQNRDVSTDPNAHIHKMTGRIVWGSILLCAFINLVLVVHAITYAAGWLGFQSLVGFAILTAQFHFAALVLSCAALGLSFAFSRLEGETA